MLETMDVIAASMLRIEHAADSCDDGLPEAVFLFVSRLTPLVNVDLLIQDPELGVLLTWRDDEFYGPGWHVPGGIIRLKETAAERIAWVARLELHTTVDFEPAPVRVDECLHPHWRDRGHFVSLLYRCRLTGPLDAARRFMAETPLPDHWQWHPRCPANLIPEQRAYAAFIGTTGG